MHGERMDAGRHDLGLLRGTPGRAPAQVRTSRKPRALGACPFIPLPLDPRDHPRPRVHALPRRYPRRPEGCEYLVLLLDRGLDTYRPVVHGQANILVDDNYRARLADFGVATVLYNSPTAATTTYGGGVAGTVRWMSPELHELPEEGVAGPKPSVLSDIYSLAMTIWEVSASAP
jgi:hypothetical protein